MPRGSIRRQLGGPPGGTARKVYRWRMVAGWTLDVFQRGSRRELPHLATALAFGRAGTDHVRPYRGGRRSRRAGRPLSDYLRRHAPERDLDSRPEWRSSDFFGGLCIVTKIFVRRQDPLLAASGIDYRRCRTVGHEPRLWEERARAAGAGDGLLQYLRGWKTGCVRSQQGWGKIANLAGASEPARAPQAGDLIAHRFALLWLPGRVDLPFSRRTGELS